MLPLISFPDFKIPQVQSMPHGMFSQYTMAETAYKLAEKEVLDAGTFRTPTPPSEPEAEPVSMAAQRMPFKSSLVIFSSFLSQIM